MGIQHIESLSLGKFLDTIKNLSKFTASEKLDGSAMTLGVDEKGMWCGREGKRAGAQRFYDSTEWPLFGAWAAFRSAHAALENVKQDVLQVLQQGQSIELEVIYGTQPNAVSYGVDGKSYIAFLHGGEGTPDEVTNRLSAALHNKTVSVTSEQASTTDGESVIAEKVSATWQFTTPQVIHLKQNELAKLSGMAEKLEQWLDEKDEVIGVTRKELLVGRSTAADKNTRAEWDPEKKRVLAELNQRWKLPIKQELIDTVLKQVRSGISDDDQVEGIVLRDPATGDLVKVVDTTTFTAINTFNHTIQASISGTILTTDENAPIASRGGLAGATRIEIASLLGNPDLAKTRTAKEIVSQVMGTSEKETAANIAANLDINDWLGLRRKIIAVIDASIKNLGEQLKIFKEEYQTYRLTLHTGKVITLSDAVVQRTLLSFAEGKRDLMEMREKLASAPTAAEAIHRFIGRAIRTAMTTPQNDNANLQESKRAVHAQNDKVMLHGKDAISVQNTYLAVLLATVLAIKENDEWITRWGRDRPHYHLTSYGKTMSVLNFWGWAVWRCSSAAVKKELGHATSAQIWKNTGHIQQNWWKLLHMDLSWVKKDSGIPWDNHHKTIATLIKMSGLASRRLNSCMKVFLWQNLSLDEKTKCLNDLYLFCQQWIPSSPLFNKVREINSKVILTGAGESELVISENKKVSLLKTIVEDDAPSPSSAPTTPLPSFTNIASIAQLPTRVGASRQVIMRKRNPNITKPKFSPSKDEK